MATLPSRDQHGNVVMALRLTDYDPSKCCVNDIMNGWFMLQDITMREQGAVPGFVFVVDTKGFVLGHIGRINIATLKIYYMYIQVWTDRYFLSYIYTGWAISALPPFVNRKA
jgi:hypothetical protein